MMQILLVRALGPWLLQIGSVLSVHLLWTPQPPRPRRFASIAIALGETILRGPFLQQLLVAHWSLVAQIQARALWASLLSFERCMLFEPLQWWYMFVSMFESRQDPFDLLHLAATKSSNALKNKPEGWVKQGSFTARRSRTYDMTAWNHTRLIYLCECSYTCNTSLHATLFFLFLAGIAKLAHQTVSLWYYCILLYCIIPISIQFRVSQFGIFFA